MPAQGVLEIDDLEELTANRAERKLTSSAIFLLKLFSPDRETRLAGAKNAAIRPVCRTPRNT